MLAVTRTTSQTYIDGRVVPGTSSVVQVRANVQPILKSTDTYLLPAADRSKAVIKVYTSGSALQQLKEGGSGWSADQFVWQGEVYEVMKVINYAMGTLEHYKALCSRVELT